MFTNGLKPPSKRLVARSNRARRASKIKAFRGMCPGFFVVRQAIRQAIFIFILNCSAKKRKELQHELMRLHVDIISYINGCKRLYSVCIKTWRLGAWLGPKALSKGCVACGSGEPSKSLPPVLHGWFRFLG
ncbi:hypothetical protein TcarDRAFT_0087 [Thermosinus carboxydivorans Nor1]|uniref:Uncharacterized protein n=1 Tax=Thermosinus carboxydivorans Nor1 TaxID=401526 RepID=A1HUF3_9FIRM|nr:hypothetical protein TcarDRAFT_0087 [Thermosinus carboxydivorans Nor1]